MSMSEVGHYFEKSINITFRVKKQIGLSHLKQGKDD